MRLNYLTGEKKIELCKYNGYNKDRKSYIMISEQRELLHLLLFYEPRVARRVAFFIASAGQKSETEKLSDI